MNGPSVSQKIEPKMEEIKAVIANRLKQQFTTAYYKPDFVDEFECDICCVDFVKYDAISILPCSDKHIFHDDCIDAWINHAKGKNTKPECPLCRKEIEDNSIKHKNFYGFTKKAIQDHNRELQKYEEEKEKDKTPALIVSEYHKLIKMEKQTMAD